MYVGYGKRNISEEDRDLIRQLLGYDDDSIDSIEKAVKMAKMILSRAGIGSKAFSDLGVVYGGDFKPDSLREFSLSLVQPQKTDHKVIAEQKEYNPDVAQDWTEIISAHLSGRKPRKPAKSWADYITEWLDGGK